MGHLWPHASTAALYLLLASSVLFAVSVGHRILAERSLLYTLRTGGATGGATSASVVILFHEYDCPTGLAWIDRANAWQAAKGSVRGVLIGVRESRIEEVRARTGIQFPLTSITERSGRYLLASVGVAATPLALEMAPDGHIARIVHPDSLSDREGFAGRTMSDRLSSSLPKDGPLP